MTGEPATSIFEAIKRRGGRCRPVAKARKSNPPFGWAWLNGELVINPIEYRTVQTILGMYHSGMRPFHIEKQLNERGVPTRGGGRWFARVISRVIEHASSPSQALAVH